MTTGVQESGPHPELCWGGRARTGSGLVHVDVVQLMSNSSQDIHLSGTPLNMKKDMFKREDTL